MKAVYEQTDSDKLLGLSEDPVKDIFDFKGLAVGQITRYPSVSPYDKRPTRPYPCMSFSRVGVARV